MVLVKVRFLFRVRKSQISTSTWGFIMGVRIPQHAADPTPEGLAKEEAAIRAIVNAPEAVSKVLVPA